MQFTSTAYLVFLTLVFFLYWALSHRLKAQNVLLLVASYVFYGWWDARLLLIIALMTIATFGFAIAIDATPAQGIRQKRKRRVLCGIGIFVCVCTLAVFKYFDFFTETGAELIRALGFKCTPLTLNILLPAGISFYTFQTVSYLIDVYRNELRATRDLVAYSTFVAFFPQLVAGPIERGARMIPILQNPRTFNYAQATEGLRRIMLGLFKKMVIADNCAETVSSVFGSWNSHGSGVLAFAAVMFTIEIYCDFSGYSDIAIGSAKLFGIELSENFKSPYLSKSIAEFWRRWHITLMSWFKDYIYIPLGGGRSHKQRNVLSVFALSGLWHGANMTFVVWGIYNALLFVPFARISKWRVPKFLMWLVTFICVVFGFLIFRSASLTDAFGYICRMFTFTGLVAVPPSATHSLVALIAAMLLFGAEYKYRRETSITALFTPMPPLLRRAAYIIIVSCILVFGAEPAAFIYFQF